MGPQTWSAADLIFDHKDSLPSTQYANDRLRLVFRETSFVPVSGDQVDLHFALEA
jgi:hypothetical protein